MDQDQECECVRRAARDGDRAAFALLIDAYWDRLRRWLFGLSGHAEVAEDLTQETFLRAWQALPKLKADETFRVWLFRIARHRWLDARRGPRGRPVKPLAGELPDHQPGPVARVVEAEMMERLEIAVARLPETYRAAYLLWAQQGIPYMEIAAILGIGAETARWRVCVARQKLVQEMRPYLDRSPS